MSGRLNRVYKCLHDVEVVGVFVFYDVTEDNDKRDEWRRKNKPGFLQLASLRFLYSAPLKVVTHQLT